MKKLGILFIALVGFAIHSNAQITKTATASATIVMPIGLTKNIDMNFGNVAVSAAAGTVVMATDGTRTPNGGVTLPAVAGTVAAAIFEVSGTPAYTYAITLPSGATTLDDGAGHTMDVDAFTSLPDATGTLDAGTGKQLIKVGATLTVGASQVAGFYTSATPFQVTVNYN